MRLIVTRPEPDASRTARALIRLGHTAILSPMLDIVPEPKVKLPKREFQALLVTSSNAVRSLSGAFDRTLPVFAVGDRTALEAKRAGFATVRSAGGAVEDLAALAAAELSPSDAPLLHAAGRDQAGDLAGLLQARGFAVECVVVYRAEPRARLADVATTALEDGSVDGVLLYSRHASEAFTAALRGGGLTPLSERIVCYCISAGAAEPLAAVTAGGIAVADAPNQLSLFALIESKAAAETRR
jgi:uroporphyrinogen-III synthase